MYQRSIARSVAAGEGMAIDSIAIPSPYSIETTKPGAVVKWRPAVKASHVYHCVLTHVVSMDGSVTRSDFAAGARSRTPASQRRSGQTDKRFAKVCTELEWDRQACPDYA